MDGFWVEIVKQIPSLAELSVFSTFASSEAIRQ